MNMCGVYVHVQLVYCFLQWQCSCVVPLMQVHFGKRKWTPSASSTIV